MIAEYHEYSKTPELYTLKMTKMGNFMLYEFYLKENNNLFTTNAQNL